MLAWFATFGAAGMLSALAVDRLPLLGPVVAVVALTAWAHAVVLGFGAVFQRSVRRLTPIVLVGITFVSYVAGSVARWLAPGRPEAAPAAAGAALVGLTVAWIATAVVLRRRRKALELRAQASGAAAGVAFREQLRLGRLRGYWYFWAAYAAFDLVMRFASPPLRADGPSLPGPSWIFPALRVLLTVVMIAVLAVLPVMDVRATAGRLRVRWLAADPVEVELSAVTEVEPHRASFTELAPWMRNLETGKRRVLNFFSRRAVRLTLATGATIVVGTCRPEGLIAAIGQEK